MVFKKKSGESDAEKKAKERLADIESRIDDTSHIQEMEQRIVFLKQKNELELQAARLEADRRVKAKDDEILAVKGKANETMEKWKAALETEKAKAAALVKDLQRLEAQLKAVEKQRATLGAKGLRVDMVPEAPSRAVAEDARAFVDQLISRQREVVDRLARIEAAMGAGSLHAPASDAQILIDRAKELLTNPELRSKALTVSEKARMFASDPGKSQYYVELLAPYADAIRKVLESSTKGSVVYGAQEALNVVEVSFRDSRTFLLRRSGALDGHKISAVVTLDRLDQDAGDALGRMAAIIDNARALGPVDFFHNMMVDVSGRVQRGEQGAKAAAWILSDVTVAVLEDEKVRAWLAGQR